MDSDKPPREHLLRLLDAHGQQFLSNFINLEKPNSTDDVEDRPSKLRRIGSNHSEEEWLGIDRALELSDNDMGSEISEGYQVPFIFEFI
jgi:hypothetical protein